MKNNYQSKAVPRGTRTIWRYLSALFILFSLSIGNVWGTATVYHTFAAAGDTIVDLEGTGSTPSAKFTAVNNTNWAAVSTSTKNNSIYRMNPSTEEVATSKTNVYGTKLGSSAKSTYKVTGVSNVIFYVGTGTASRIAKLDVTPNGESKVSEAASVTLSDKNNAYKMSYSLDASKSYTLEAYASADIFCYAVKFTVAPSSSVAPAITAPTTDQSATYTVGDVITPLSVTATGSPAPSYQWYSNASASATGATLITGAESASYTPSSAAESDLYFYCVATNSEGSAQSPYFHVEVNAAVATAPSFTSPASEPAVAEYSVGDAISALEVVAAGYPAPTLQWYSNSSKSTEGATLITGAESASYTPSNAAVSDLYFYCVATNASGTAQSEYFHVTVAAVSYCAELNPATSGDEPVLGTVIAMQTGSYGGSIKVVGRKQSGSFAYTANGLTFNKGGVDSVRVTLNHLIKKDTKIYVTVNNQDGSKDQGFYLQNLSKTKKADMHRQNGSTGDTTYVYTADNGDGLVGVNEFIIARGASSAALKSLKVSNCGAELFALNSAIYPVEADGKATITLSKNFVENGGTATATYSDIDAEYDFDGWLINGTGASIDDASANPVTITMGSEAVTITLKLKAAGTKYPVHFDSKGGSAVDDQLVDEGGHASVPTAPTKFKYTFGGWSETDGGAAADLASVVINAEKTFYAIWTPKVCPTSGIIYSFVSDGTKAPGSNTYCPASGVQGVVDIASYATVSGGLAQAVHTTTSNNPIQIQTSTSAVKLSHADGYFRALLECPLQEGDTIKFVKTNKVKIAFDSLRTKVVDIASGTNNYIVPALYAGEDTIMVYYAGSSVNLTSLKVVRPAHFAVTFNMHGHGDAVDPQSVVEGGKVSEPADPTASGWDFGGWFTDDTYGTYWDFENMTISSATEIHALWTEHVLSDDATLSSLSYTIGGGDPIAIPLVTDQYAYAVELPMGTDIDAPVIAAVANDPNRKDLTIVQTNLGQATVTVTAEDNSTIQSYAITFSVATSKAIQLVFKTGTTPCVGSASTATQILSNNAAVSTYINQITFTNVEGAGDDGAEGSSLNVGKKAGNMFTLSAKVGYAFQAMNFLAKIQDATCEYSINGGDWTELASTSTSADECYAPFTSGMVHEFRLRSTGASGVWIRNMQLTLIEACTPVAITWDEEPVEFEVGAAGQVIAATANTGNDVEYSSNTPLVIAVDAVNGLLSIGDLGSATLSASTAEGDGTTFCENGGANIVLSKVVNTYYLVSFDGQNGDAADEVKFYSGSSAIALPAAPSYPGYDFQGWFDAETGGNQFTEDITPTASMTVYAQWVAQCDGATITTQPVGASYLTGRTPAALVCEATAGAGGALTYEWFTCDDDQKTNPVAASATPSTAVAGTFYYFCKVMEAGCDKETFSDVVTITVTDKDPIYLTWVDVTANNTVAVDALKSLYAPEVSASNVKNTSTYGGKTGYKFNSDPAYIAIEGAPFKAGDIVEMFVTNTTADKARVFNANEAIAANVVAEGAANMVQGANKVALTADANNLYLRRGNDFGGWNPSIAYVAVYRACAPILNKMTVAGVEAAPDNTNHVAIEVPFSTADAALDAIAYDWISNDAAWTAAHEPAVANAWEWGVENTVTFADKDGDESVYYITISKAAASSDATLSALTVNGQAIALADGVFDYTFELPYGTTVAPTVVATANHVAATATVDPCTISGATIIVVPESGAGDQQIYTLTFVISKWKEVVIWDGSNMTELATSPGALGMAWETVGFSSVASYNTTYGEKAYTKYLPSGGAATSRYMTLTVPAGYVAKFYVVMASHSDGNERGMFIGSNLVKDPDATSVLELSNNDRDIAVAGTSEIVGAGTWYINPNASIDIQEIRAYLRPGYVRTGLSNGVLGTVCVDHNVAIEDIQGVTVYELVGREPQYGKVAFDEIISGELEAGAPYVFQAHGNHMALLYGETSVAEPVDKGNGMYGTFVDQTLTELNDIYYFAQRALWSCVDLSSLSVPANRAYVKLSEIDYISDPNPAPGRRRVMMSVNGKNTPTALDEIRQEQSANSQKLLINGQLFILRGEKMYDATGRLVK